MTEWHLPPAMQDEVEPAELGRPPTAAFYCVPMVKQLIRLACHVVYVSLISYAAMETDSSATRGCFSPDKSVSIALQASSFRLDTFSTQWCVPSSSSLAGK